MRIIGEIVSELARNLNLKNVTAVIFILLMAFPISSLVSASTPTDAASTIASARAQLINAYLSTRDAEQSGANITSLTATLNEAGSLLSRAEQAFSIGDYSSSQSLAVQCQEKLGDLNNRAVALKEVAAQEAVQDFWFSIIYPISGSVAVIAVGLAIWFLLKRKYTPSGTITNGSSTL